MVHALAPAAARFAVYGFACSVAFGIVVAIPGLASGGTIYEYVGNPFDTIVDEAEPSGSYTTSMRIEGFVELATPLAADLDLEVVDSLVLDFSFSDGRQTIDTGVIGIDVTFLFSTDATGDILDWLFALRRTPLPTGPGDVGGVISSLGGSDLALLGVCQASGPSGCADLSNDEGRVVGAPASAWTIVPEPSTGALAALGLIALACRGRRSARG